MVARSFAERILVKTGPAVGVVGATDGAGVVAVVVHHVPRACVAHVGEALEGAVHRTEVRATHIRRHCLKTNQHKE